jgi:hypothetical protein
MTHKVSFSSGNNFSVRLKTTQRFNVDVKIGGTQVPAQFSDLSDYNAAGLQDKYLIMYDAATQKYIPVNPDVVLSAAAVTEPISPGLPADFENVLDVDLDNRIDLDAGGF